MTEQTVEETYHQENDILLKDVILFLMANIWTIMGITVLITSISIIYVLRITPIYEAVVEIYPASDLSISKINNERFKNIKILPSSDRNYRKEDVFEMVLNKISSNSFKSQVFTSKNYSEKLNLNNGADGSLALNYVRKIRQHDKNIEDYAKFTLEGEEPLTISSLLNDIVKTAISESSNDIKIIQQSEIDTRIDYVNTELIVEIENIKERRINELNTLKKQLDIAKSLNHKESNFSQISSIGSGSLPPWYMYGEEALLQEINKLTLDKTYSNADTIALKAQRDILTSIDPPDFSDIELVDVAWSFPPKGPIEPKRRLIVITVFCISLIISIAIAYIVNLFWTFRERQ